MLVPHYSETEILSIIADIPTSKYLPLLIPSQTNVAPKQSAFVTLEPSLEGKIHYFFKEEISIATLKVLKNLGQE